MPEKSRQKLDLVRKEIKKIVVGQDKTVDTLLKAVLTNAHVLVEGLPGIAKTILLRALATTMGCEFKRVQFTVDLLPTDITGLTIYNRIRGFYVVKGPVFTNFLLADEINRSPPKTQSALLEAMQEKQVTIGKKTFKINQPFFVMATINPLESEGVYDLPEAQLDRFLMKIRMSYPSLDEEFNIIDQNVEIKSFEEYKIKAVLSPRNIIKMQKMIKDNILINKRAKKYITRIIDATRNPEKYKLKLGKYIGYGASPRATIGLSMVSKADAFLAGRKYVTPQNVKNVAYEVLRHRILLNYEGTARKIDSDDIIQEILSKVRST